VALDRFVDDLRAHVTLDDRFSTADLVSLARFVASLSGEQVHRTDLPVAPAMLGSMPVLVTAQGADTVLSRFGGHPSAPTGTTTVTHPYAPQAPPEATPAPCD
jgi:hypothetical protein